MTEHVTLLLPRLLGTREAAMEIVAGIDCRPQHVAIEARSTQAATTSALMVLAQWVIESRASFVHIYAAREVETDFLLCIERIESETMHSWTLQATSDTNTWYIHRPEYRPASIQTRNGNGYEPEIIWGSLNA